MADVSKTAAKECRTGHIVFRALGTEFLPAGVRPASPQRGGGASSPANDLLRVRRAASPKPPSTHWPAHPPPPPWEAEHATHAAKLAGDKAGLAAVQALGSIPSSQQEKHASSALPEGCDVRLAHLKDTQVHFHGPDPSRTGTAAHEGLGAGAPQQQEEQAQEQEGAEEEVEEELDGDASSLLFYDASGPQALKSAMSRFGSEKRMAGSRQRVSLDEAGAQEGAVHTDEAADVKCSKGRARRTGLGARAHPSRPHTAPGHRTASTHAHAHGHARGRRVSPSSGSPGSSSPSRNESSTSPSPRSVSPFCFATSPTHIHHPHGHHAHGAAHAHSTKHGHPLYAKTLVAQAALSIAQPKVTKVKKAAPPPTKAVIRELLEAAQAMAEFHTINAQHLPNHILLERLAETLKGNVDRSSVALEAARAAAALARGEVPGKMLFTLTNTLASLTGLMQTEVVSAKADESFQAMLRSEITDASQHNQIACITAMLFGGDPDTVTAILAGGFGHGRRTVSTSPSLRHRPSRRWNGSTAAVRGTGGRRSSRRTTSDAPLELTGSHSRWMGRGSSGPGSGAADGSRFAAMIEANSLSKHSQSLKGGFFTLAHLRTMIKEHRKRVGWSWEELQTAGREAKAREEVEAALRDMHEAAITQGNKETAAAVEEALIMHLAQSGALDAGSEEDMDDGDLELAVAPGSVGAAGGGSMASMSSQGRKKLTHSLRSSMRLVGVSMRASVSGMKSRTSQSGLASSAGVAGTQGLAGSSAGIGAAVLRASASRLSGAGRMPMARQHSLFGPASGRQSQTGSLGLSLLSLRMSMAGGQGPATAQKQTLSLAESATTLPTQGFAGGEGGAQAEATAAPGDERGKLLRSVLSRVHSGSVLPVAPLTAADSSALSPLGRIKSSMSGRQSVAGWTTMVSKKTAAAAQGAAGVVASVQVSAAPGASGGMGSAAGSATQQAVAELLAKAASSRACTSGRASISQARSLLAGGEASPSAVSASRPHTSVHTQGPANSLPAGSAHMDPLDWEVVSILSGRVTGSTSGTAHDSLAAPPHPSGAGGGLPSSGHLHNQSAAHVMQNGAAHALLMQAASSGATSCKQAHFVGEEAQAGPRQAPQSSLKTQLHVPSSGHQPDVDVEQRMLAEWEQWRAATKERRPEAVLAPGAENEEEEEDEEEEWSEMDQAGGVRAVIQAAEVPITPDMRAAAAPASPFVYTVLRVEVADVEDAHALIANKNIKQAAPNAGTAATADASGGTADLQPVHYTAYIRKRRLQKLHASASPRLHAPGQSPTSPKPVVVAAERVPVANDLWDEEGLPIEDPTTSTTSPTVPPKSPGPKRSGAASHVSTTWITSAVPPCSPASTSPTGRPVPTAVSTPRSPGMHAGGRAASPTGRTTASARPMSALGRGHGGAGCSRPGSAAHSPVWVLEAYATAAHYATHGADAQPGGKGMLPVGDEDWSWGDVASRFMPSPSELVEQVMSSEVEHGVGSGITAAAQLAASAAAAAGPSPTYRPATAPMSQTRPGSASPTMPGVQHFRLLSARLAGGAHGSRPNHLAISAPSSPTMGLHSSKATTPTTAVQHSSTRPMSARPTSARPTSTSPGAALASHIPVAHSPLGMPRRRDMGFTSLYPLPVIEASDSEGSVERDKVQENDVDEEGSEEQEQGDGGIDSDDGSGGIWDVQEGSHPSHQAAAVPHLLDVHHVQQSWQRLPSARLMQKSVVQASSARAAFAASPHHPPYAALHVLGSETFERQLPRQYRDCMPTLGRHSSPASSRAARHRNHVTTPQAAPSPHAGMADSAQPSTTLPHAPHAAGTDGVSTLTARPGSVPPPVSDSHRHCTYSFSPPLSAHAYGAVAGTSGALQRPTSAMAVLGNPYPAGAVLTGTSSVAATNHAGALAGAQGATAPAVNPHSASALLAAACDGSAATGSSIGPAYLSNIARSRPASAVPPALTIMAFSPSASPSPTGRPVSPSAAAAGGLSPTKTASARAGSARRGSTPSGGAAPERIAAACTLLARASQPCVLVLRPPSAGGVMLRPASPQPAGHTTTQLTAATQSTTAPPVPASPARTSASPPAPIPTVPSTGDPRPPSPAPVPQSSRTRPLHRPLHGTGSQGASHLSHSSALLRRSGHRPHSPSLKHSAAHTVPAHMLAGGASGYGIGAAQVAAQSALVTGQGQGAVHASAGTQRLASQPAHKADPPTSWAYGGITAGMGVVSTQALASLSPAVQQAPLGGPNHGLASMIKQRPVRHASASNGQPTSSSARSPGGAHTTDRNGWHAPGTAQYMSELIAFSVSGGGRGLDLKAVRQAMLTTTLR